MDISRNNSAHQVPIDLSGIEDLEFDLLKLKLQDPEEGKGWTPDYTDTVCSEYKKFLALTRQYPKKAIVPSGPVDTFWHYHILDTQAYEVDCDKVFGFFLHHFPYFGMRSSQDSTNLQHAWDETRDLYSQHFGEQPEGLWASGSRCPKCGRIEHEYAMPRTIAAV